TDTMHKPPSHFITLLVKAAARGGNLLMNIGPRGDGMIDTPDVAILSAIGKWMTTNGESIYGTTRSPLPVQAWGESTVKDKTLYLHVFNWPKDGKLVVGGMKTKITGAYVLADAAKTPLHVEKLNDRDFRIDVPAQAPDQIVSVIAAQCEGEVLADVR